VSNGHFLRLVSLGVALGSLASANVFTFSFTSPSESGSGSLTATPNGDGSETVTAISGTLARTYALSNLLPPGTAFGTPSFTTDNLIFPGAPAVLSAAGGLVFQNEPLGNVALYANTPGNYVQLDHDYVQFFFTNLQFTLTGPDSSHPGASDFSFSYSTTGGVLSASGTLWATPNGDGSWTAMGLSGAETIVWPITGLIPAGTYLDNDNLIFPGGSQVVDVPGGLAFTTFGTQELLTAGGAIGPYDDISTPSFIDYKVSSINLTAVTPEPSTFLLVAGGFGMIYRRKSRRR
jgi:hypothetical protein